MHKLFLGDALSLIRNAAVLTFFHRLQLGKMKYRRFRKVPCGMFMHILTLILQTFTSDLIRLTTYW